MGDIYIRLTSPSAKVLALCVYFLFPSRYKNFFPHVAQMHVYAQASELSLRWETTVRRQQKHSSQACVVVNDKSEEERAPIEVWWHNLGEAFLTLRGNMMVCLKKGRCRFVTGDEWIGSHERFHGVVVGCKLKLPGDVYTSSWKFHEVMRTTVGRGVRNKHPIFPHLSLFHGAITVLEPV